MKNNMQLFTNPEFGQVRTVDMNGDVWLVGKDVATALGYSNASKAVAVHVDDDDKRFEMLTMADSQNGNVPGATKTALINESGLYSLVMSSKLPNAKKFRRWVTSEVLPSIRKHGGYINGQSTMTDSELIAQALLLAKRQIDERDAQITEMQPKAVFADAVAASKNSILVGEMAKLLKQNGVNIGQNRLFTWLRDNGYLINRPGSSFNAPTQRAMEMGLMEIKETTICHADGHTSIVKTPKITGKGQQYFANKFLA